MTPKKVATYGLENIRQHKAALHQLARNVENFLSLGTEPEFFVSITAPDLENSIRGDPAARELAFKYWKIERNTHRRRRRFDRRKAGVRS